MSGERPGPAQTMATALHERGVASMVSRSDNGLLIRVGNRYVPRLLELLAPTPAPPNPDTDGEARLLLSKACAPRGWQPGEMDADERQRRVAAYLDGLATTPAPVTPPTEGFSSFDDLHEDHLAHGTGIVPTPPETVPAPRAALDRLVDCHRFFCTSGTTPCCPAGEWIAAAGVSGE